jgi:alpha-galactosidase
MNKVKPKRTLMQTLSLILLCLARSAVAALGQAPDLTSPDLWKPENVLFSFQYDGKPSSKILASWQASDENVAAGGGQVHRYYYTDPATHLKVTAEVRLFPDFPGTVDWVLRFRNDGTTDTPIIENILPLHWAIPASPGDCAIRHDKGSYADGDDFKPLEEHFGPGGNDHLESTWGNSSWGNTLPFFNLQTGDHGVIGAIGWTGNWKADFSNAQDGKSISMMSGMKATHLLLHPGEEIRTPRIVLQAWTGGSWQNSQNGWRRLILAHYTPQDDGKPMVGPILVAGGWGGEDINVKIAYIKWIHDHQIPVGLFGIDAGWYGASFGVQDDPTNPWWKNRGDWFPSPLYYPHGMKPLGDACKAAGLGFLVWIEPETTMPDKKIVKEHPDWFLHSNHPVWPGVEMANYSNPAALRGISDMVSGFITDFGMTWYRQDFNLPPEEYWALNDTPDRVGMTEIGHIEGLYKLWDELLAKHPGLHIDNCASGGHRIDIETMSRSFVVWRTDNAYYDLNAEQAQTTALVPWVPGTMGFETYTETKPWAAPGPYTTPEHLYRMRLGYEAAYAVRVGAPGVDNEAWVAWIKQAIGEYREVQPYFYGDFDALLPYSRGDETWTAWQWDRPAKKDGLVILLRRPGSPFTTMQLGLQHLNPDASYEVETRKTYDKAPLVEMKGSDLAKLQVQLPDAPSSTLVFYRQK